MTTFQWVLFFLGLAILISAGYAGFLFAPWVPTRRRDLERIKRLANLKAGQTAVELGSGTGLVSIAFAEVPGVTVIGYELVLPLVLYARLNAWRKKRPVTFFWKNFFKEDLSSADVVYFFGTKERVQGAFAKKIWQELKPGGKILSYTVAFEGVEPDFIDKPSDQDLSIFVYVKKERPIVMETDRAA